MLLCLFFVAIVTFLLQISLLQAMGGALLFWIVWRLIREGGEDEVEEEGRTGTGA